MMYSFSGPPQVRRKLIPAERVTSAKDMLDGDDLPRVDADAARAGCWDGKVRCGSESPESQMMLAAAAVKTNTHPESRPLPIIGRAQPPSHRSQAALCSKQ